jgi:hypothetical protein
MPKTQPDGKVSQPLFILEGPDGAGKTTLATRIAKIFGAQYIHHGSYRNVKSLGKVYVDSLMLAVQGQTPVVLDRSWLSEPIYADVFRGGKDRLGPEGVRFLNRLALRCRAFVIRCLPPFDVVEKNVAATRADEHHNDLMALRQVYD